MGARRIVIRTGGLGDLVLFYPTLRALHERSGEPWELVTSSGLIPEVYRHCPWVGEVHVARLRKGPRILNRSLRAIDRLAAGGIASLYDLDEQAGVGGHWKALERVALERIGAEGFPPRGRHEHEGEYGLRMIGTAPGEPLISAEGFAAGVHPVLPVTEGEMGECREWLAALGVRGERRVLLQPGNKLTMKAGAAHREENRKYWPEDRWVRVIEAAREAGCSVLLSGASAEWEWLETLRTGSGGEGVWNVARELPVRRFMALARCEGSIYLGVDTGPAHLAGAMGCPAVVLYGPSSMVNFLPLSWGQLIVPLEKPGEVRAGEEDWIRPEIGLITVEEVVAALEQVLAEGRHPEEDSFRGSTIC